MNDELYHETNTDGQADSGHLTLFNCLIRYDNLINNNVRIFCSSKQTFLISDFGSHVERRYDFEYITLF